MSIELPSFTIKEMLEAGVHFGHKTMRWNPKMSPFIYGTRNGVHIIDLQKTAPLMLLAMREVYKIARNNGKILFVGTKRQASESIKESATRCGQFFVNKRWLGGMLTNWSTVSQSIKKLEEIENILESENSGETAKYSKKELLDFDRKRQKLEDSLGGIRKMRGKPDIIFVIDTNQEDIAIKEAQKLNIPVIAVVDTNSDPDGIDYIIPGNDDAEKSINLYCSLISETILKAIEDSLVSSGVDVAQAKEHVRNLPNIEQEKKKAIKSAPAKAQKIITAIKLSADEVVEERKIIIAPSEDKPQAKSKEAAAKKTTKLAAKPKKELATKEVKKALPKKAEVSAEAKPAKKTTTKKATIEG